MQGVIGTYGKTGNLASLVDIENDVSLTHYLRENGYCDEGMPDSYKNMQGGVSCKTVLINMGEDRQSMVFKQALPKLRVEADWFTNEGRLLVEAKGLQWIAELIDDPVTPDFLFYDEDAKILAMKAIAEPHQNWKESLLSGSVIPDLFIQFGELLANIHHSAFYKQQNVKNDFQVYDYFETLRLEAFYHHTAIMVPESYEFMSAIEADTRSHRLTLTHGDYSPKNVLVKGGNVMILDHETMHWGDPAFDLGFATAHFLSKATLLLAKRQHLLSGAHEFFKAYVGYDTTSRWGFDFEARVVRHSLGCCLARVGGKSPVSYLSEKQAAKQKAVCLELMQAPPTTYVELIVKYGKLLNI